ncbi:diguanylate cyclase domain-containing protein [Krasilnikovia sp. MM14-A1259]|uniref:diguanylate cyclase domain-containing protein n=1 Tax=Krasilnikovia sp. MM14-A1259 TaxID=3373539 RepID=UPI00399D4FE5
MTVSSGVRLAGSRDGFTVPAQPHAVDEQTDLLAALVDVMTRDTPVIEHVLDLVHRYLGEYAGLRCATVFTLSSEDGGLYPVATVGEPEPGELRTAGMVFRVPAGAPPTRNGDRLTVRLRIGGQTVGVLVLTGGRLDLIRVDVIASAGLHLAATLQSLEAERQRQFLANATTTIRRLFEQGTVATSVETAAELVARATAEAFRTEFSGLHLVDTDGRIRYATGVGPTAEITEALQRNLIGKMADDSPIWRAAVRDGSPVLVGDVETVGVSPGGFVHTMGLRSFIAMPLMSATGPVGIVLCGDANAGRRWSADDHGLARQLAVEGALIVDSARLRQAEQLHVAELTRQAFHDALTGLPNRSHLLEGAEQAVTAATRADERTALLLLDLDGFKQVNDSAGHHAGDALLQAVAHRLLRTVRENDLVSRLGGDEFAILLTRNPDAASAATIAERIHQRLSEPFDIEGRSVTIGASIGVALFPDDASDVPHLLRGADAAMYRAKRHGGGVRLAR